MSLTNYVTMTPDVQVNDNKLYVMSDPTGMQHEETFMFAYGPIRRRWPVAPREVSAAFPLHPSVIERLEAGLVSHVGEMRAYRPKQLRDHPSAKSYFNDGE